MLQHDYGFIRGTDGRDGDEIDAILGPDESAALVYIADFTYDDEDKVLIGFPTEDQAVEAFLSMYPADSLGGIESVPIDEYKTSLGLDFGTEAVDLDGTLAEYHGFQGADHIGAPIPLMVNRVKRFLAEGRPVVILTARVANGDPNGARPYIEDWCREVFGVVLPVTAEKTPDIVRIWDDRAAAVEPNTGVRKAEWSEEDHPRDEKGEFTAGAGAAPPEGGRVSSKAELAKANYKPSTAEKQRIADESERKLASALGIERTKDNAPFDLHDKGRGIEIKTLIDNKNDKITMHPESRGRKLEFAEKNNLRMYTVVADMRDRSRASYYFSKGVGSFRIGSMQKVTLSELKTLIK